VSKVGDNEMILFFIIEGFSVSKTLMYILFSITACLLYVSVFVSFNALAFRFGNVHSLTNLVLEFMITLSIYPADMFQGLIRLILFTILPAGFVTMVPVNLLNDFDLKWFLLLIFATVIWICISFISFNSGLRKYESGNLMVQKM